MILYVLVLICCAIWDSGKMQDMYRNHTSCRIFVLQFGARDSALRLFLMSIAEWHGIATRFRQLPVSFCLVMSKSDTWEAKIRMTWEGKCWNQRKLPSCEASSERGCDMDRFRLLIWLYASSSAYASAHASACAYIYIIYTIYERDDASLFGFRSFQIHMPGMPQSSHVLNVATRLCLIMALEKLDAGSVRVRELWFCSGDVAVIDIKCWHLIDGWLCMCVQYIECIYTWYWLHYHYSYQLMVNLQPWK